ncbi:MAG TPA: cytochrome c biogenesis protein CcdA [Anaerolineae bacterium]|nr:cytochrome c biogenesis protein CcdA [Anaerolineae bacterium]
MATQTMPKRKTVTFAMRFQVFTHAALFVLGLSLVIVIVFGGTATILGDLLGSNTQIISQIGGLVVIVFGVHTLGIIKIPFLNYDTRRQYSGGTSYASSVLMGVFFAAGWSPCIGPIFGLIITLGLSQATVFSAMFLAAFYALGLGLPFLLLGLLVDRATGILRRLRKYIRVFEIFTGVFLIVLGIMLATGQMTRFASWAASVASAIDTSAVEYSLLKSGNIVANPTIPIAFIAGLLSFLSPCVLPLVPAYLGYLGGRAVNQVAEEHAA